jgi:hypothetical protein
MQTLEIYIISNKESRPGSKIDDTRKELIMYISITILRSNANLDVLSLHVRFHRNITQMLCLGLIVLIIIIIIIIKRRNNMGMLLCQLHSRWP